MNDKFYLFLIKHSPKLEILKKNYNFSFDEANRHFHRNGFSELYFMMKK